jgi:hypothetical protein
MNNFNCKTDKSNDLRSHENGKLRNISTFTNMPLLNGIDSSKYLIIEFLGVYELLNIDF